MAVEERLEIRIPDAGARCGKPVKLAGTRARAGLTAAPAASLPALTDVEEEQSAPGPKTGRIKLVEVRPETDSIADPP